MRTTKTENGRNRKGHSYLATQNEVLEAARRQMAEGGASSLSLRAIARRMGLTPPALYYYFRNREHLLTVLVVAAYNSLAGALETAVYSRAKDDHVGRLLAIALTYRAWALAHPEDHALIFGTPIPGYQAPDDVTQAALRRNVDVLVNAFEAALRDGVLRPSADYSEPSPLLQSQLDATRQRLGHTADTVSLHLALAGWCRLHGLVSLELFNHLQPILGNADEFYRSEVMSFLVSAGLQVEPFVGSASPG